MNKKSIYLYAAWLSIVVFSFALNLYGNSKNREQLTLQVAKSFFQELVATRLCNDGTKGTYTPIEFHITSLKPVQPANAPLAWEKRWLASFERGAREQHALVRDGAGERLRYMAPLYVEKGCLKCHGDYKVGDVRGGISITLPPYAPPAMGLLVMGHGLVALFGLLGLLLFNKTSSRNIKEIEEKEEKYRQLFMENTAVKLLVDPESGAIVEANEAACRFYGYGNQEILQLKIADINQLSPAAVQEEEKRAAAEERLYVVLPHQLSSGEIRQVEVYSGPVAAQGKTLLYLIIHDITERRKVEKELYFMKFAVDRSSDSAFWSEASGKLFYVNAAACEKLGYSRQELLGLKVSDFDPNFPPEAWAGHWQDLKSRRIIRLETSHRAKDGRVFPVEVMATFVEYEGQEFNCSFVRDVSKRLAAENEIKKQNIFLQNIIESLPYPFYVIDASNYALIMANSAASPQRDLAGLTCYMLTHKRDTPCDGEHHKCTLQEVRRTGQPLVIEHIHYDRQGRERYVEVSGYPILDAAGKLTQLIEYSKDITEQKLAEQERDRLENQLVQAYKMEAIGTLAGGIAHDFNNILATIMGYAEMAQEDAPPDSLFGKDLERVLIAANRAKDLVQQILTFSRQSNVARVPLKIPLIIQEGLKMLRSTIPSTIKITEKIDPRCATVLADPTQVHQVLMNLATNAFHAMEESGGVLTVALKNTGLASGTPQGSSQLAPGEYVELTVADSGAGIRPELLNKIFDPYFTTKETGKGTGMGLSIIHGIITGYGGAISVESQLGKGSVFHVYFPAVESEVGPELQETEDIPHGQERILFVDDEELLAEMGQDMLERLGYRVTVRKSSLEALEKFENDPTAFDLVITDQTMPGLTGSELARRLLAIRPELPIILCTGYSTIISAEKAKAMGIKEFALKPLVKRDIARLIRQALATG